MAQLTKCLSWKPEFQSFLNKTWVVPISKSCVLKAQGHRHRRIPRARWLDSLLNLWTRFINRPPKSSGDRLRYMCAYPHKHIHIPCTNIYHIHTKIWNKSSVASLQMFRRHGMQFCLVTEGKPRHHYHGLAKDSFPADSVEGKWRLTSIFSVGLYSAGKLSWKKLRCLCLWLCTHRNHQPQSHVFSCGPDPPSRNRKLTEPFVFSACQAR